MSKSSLEQLSLAARLRPFLRATPRGRGSSSLRIELQSLPPALSTMAMEIVALCVACGKRCHPFRSRQTKKNDVRYEPPPRSLYYAPTCDTKDNPGCCRGKHVTNEFERVRRWLAGEPGPADVEKPKPAFKIGPQRSLFGDGK